MFPVDVKQVKEEFQVNIVQDLKNKTKKLIIKNPFDREYTEKEHSSRRRY